MYHSFISSKYLSCNKYTLTVQRFPRRTLRGLGKSNVQAVYLLLIYRIRNMYNQPAKIHHTMHLFFL